MKKKSSTDLFLRVFEQLLGENVFADKEDGSLETYVETNYLDCMIKVEIDEEKIKINTYPLCVVGKKKNSNRLKDLIRSLNFMYTQELFYLDWENKVVFRIEFPCQEFYARPDMCLLFGTHEIAKYAAPLIKAMKGADVFVVSL